MHIRTFFLAFAAFLLVPAAAQAQSTLIRDIAFPTEPNAVTFTDNFGDARSGRVHEGTDIMGPKMTPLYAAVDGVVSFITIPEASWGYHLVIRDSDGYEYNYIHINNDTPGTDDGNGGVENAYAPGIQRGAVVQRGQLVGWMGDSGNAENIASHLHFEIRKNDIAYNAYPSLIAALEGGNQSGYIAELTAASPDINTDKGLIPSGGAAPCASGSLIKNNTNSAVYYCGADGKRYAFPHERVYFTWYADFDDVITMSDEQLAMIPLGGNATYRPGVRMVKIESMPNVYLVERGGVLRWIQSASKAADLYGSNWSKNVHDISDAFFVNYRIGEPI